MAQNLTRRSLVAAAPAAVAAAALCADTSSHVDAELLALRPAWNATWAAYDATFPPLAAAERACWDRCPNVPEFSSFRGSWTEYEMAARKVAATRAQLEIECGVIAAQENQRRVSEANWEVTDQIFDISARTVDGIRFKREVLLALDGVEVPKYDASLLADLLAMAGARGA